MSASGEVAAIATRTLIRTRRSPQAMFAYVAQPVLMLVLFSQVFHGVAELGLFQTQGYDSYLEFFVPSALALSVLVAGLGAGVATVTDMQAGMLDKLLIAPVRRTSIILGRLSADGVRTTLQAGALLGAGWVLGARYDTGLAGIAAAMAVTVAAALFFASCTTWLAGKARNAETVTALTNLVSLPLLVLSTALMPVESLPGWLGWPVRLNPVSHLIDLNRDLLIHGVVWTEVTIAAAALTFAVAASVLLASRSIAAHD